MTDKTDTTALVIAEELKEWARDYAPTELATALATCAAVLLKNQHTRIAKLEAQAAGKCLHQGTKPASVTYMTTDHACKWAWDQVRKEVGTEGWTTGDSCNFYGFFLWGWNYRGEYETQRPAALPAPAAVAVPAEAQAPEKWIYDPHDIEQGMMLNPKWVRAQENATQLAGQVHETTPLTDERIRQLDSATKFHESHNWSVRFARAVEAAHGIKEPTHGQQT